MIRHAVAAALAAAAVFAAPAASAATFEYTSGTRLATIAQVGPMGQSFVADQSLLTSFGFQFAVANASQANTDVVFRLLAGAGLGGTELFSRAFAVTGPANRTPVWFDFTGLNTTLTAGATYTALVGTASTRLALAFGPPSTNPTADAYAPGALVATVPSSNSFTGCGTTASVCDANFRFTTQAAATAAVPEPATWATMLGGLFAVGHAVRRRRARVAFAA